MADEIPDGSMGGYEGYCERCGKSCKKNLNGNNIGAHACLPLLTFDNKRLSEGTGIGVDLLDLWNNIEIWYGDVSKQENNKEFLNRIQFQYSIKKKVT